MAEQALPNYASPYLRKFMFDRFYPGATVEYDIVTMAEAFPDGWRDYPGKATHAVRCTIRRPDGIVHVGVKEIDLQGKYNKIAQTPEELAKNETKALGRALRDAGLPQKLDEMGSLMRMFVALEGRTPSSQKGHAVDIGTGEIEGSSDPDDVDDVDAGSEPTAEQELAKRFAELPGADKAATAKYARDTLKCTNVMKAGEHVAAINTFIDNLGVAGEEPEEEF